MGRNVSNAVLDAAERFIDRGNDDPSMRALASEAGVGASTIYEFFESKEAVLTAMLVRRLRSEMPEDLAAASTIEEAIAAFLAPRIRSTEAHPRVVALAAQRILGREGDRALRVVLAEQVSALGAHWRSRTDLACAPHHAAHVVLVALDNVVRNAAERRPHYLSDPAFVTELTATLGAAVVAEPRALPRTRAISNADVDIRPRAHRPPRRAPPSPRRVPQQRRARELVDAILRGTERVIVREGLDVTSTPAIAEAAGVSIGSLYQYFRDRDGVLEGLIDWWIAHDLRYVSQLLAEAEGKSAAETLAFGMSRFHDLTVRFLRVYRAMFRLLPRLDRYEAAQQFFAEGSRLVVEDFAKRDGAAELDVELTIFCAAHTLTSWSRHFIVVDPDFYASPDFRAIVRRYAEACMRAHGFSEALTQAEEGRERAAVRAI